MSNFLAKYPNLFVKQTKKGCLQELLCGCDANNEFKIASMEDKQHDVFYAIEDTSCCIRFFCSTARPFKIKVSQGGLAGEMHRCCPIISFLLHSFKAIIMCPIPTDTYRTVTLRWRSVSHLRPPFQVPHREYEVLLLSRTRNLVTNWRVSR